MEAKNLKWIVLALGLLAVTAAPEAAAEPAALTGDNVDDAMTPGCVRVEPDQPDVEVRPQECLQI